MWFLLDKNYIGQKEIKNIESIEVEKFSLRGIMKILIKQIKSLFWVNEVADYMYNEDANWADKVADRGKQSRWLSV